MNNREDSIYRSITKKNLILIFAVGCLIGAVFFLLVYGVRPLNVLDDEWLLSGGDLSQHYLGWCFYRNSDWQFPVGMVDGLLYPGKVCLIYTDSIPLLAVIFKILSPILPQTFQYFGLWGIFCYCMMGGLSAIIIRKATEKANLCWIGAMFFVVCPYMLQRMFRHTSLAGHWLLLLAFLIIVYKPYFKSIKRRFIAWSVLLFVSSFVHIYFIPMIAALMFGSCMEDIFSTKRIKYNIFLFIGACVPSVLGLILFGAFEGGSSFNDVGLGDYSANLNVLWNSQGRTVGRFLPPQKSLQGQYEGLGYLGLGMLIMTAAVIIYKVCKGIIGCLRRRNQVKIGNGESKKEKLLSWFQRHSLGVSLGIVGAIFAVVALSPTISFNDQILFTVPYPHKIVKAWSIFRATGRFIWPIDYMIMIAAISAVVKINKKYIGTLIVSVCMVIQVVDLSVNAIKVHDWFAQINTNEIALNAPEWRAWGEKYDHIMFLPYNFPEANPMLLYAVADYAHDYGMTLNYFFCARINCAVPENAQAEAFNELASGMGRADTLYIFPDYETALNSGLKIYQIDGFNVGLTE